MAVTSLAATTTQLVTLNEFHVILWVLFGLCALAFTIRAYIRFSCFRRLLPEDWLMVLALGCQLAIAILGQLFLVDIYNLIAAEHGGSVGPSFFTDSLRGLKVFGTMCLLSLTGIWLIKFNFLVFFHRLGHTIRAYCIFWRIVLIFTLACGATCYGLVQYSCMFGDLETIFVKCNTNSANRESYWHVIMTAVLDILSDFAILCFPVYILWNVKLNLRKKLVLAAVFGLVGVTIAVTIVRASIFSPQYKAINGGSTQQVNISWIIFWFYVEFSVSYLVACVVSFRTLFIHKEQELSKGKREINKQQEAADHLQRKKSFLERMQRFRDTTLDTCRTWEGSASWDSSEWSVLRTFRLPHPNSERLDVDFPPRDDMDSLCQIPSQESDRDPRSTVTKSV